ncbi:MAG: TonB-dependent receptor [Pseudarcicella sp.]|nr:TonB-dependent receptor [Pseudarcicella sp.]
MLYLKLILVAFALFIPISFTNAQTSDSLENKTIEIEEVTIISNKTPQSKKTTSHQIIGIKADFIKFQNKQSTADLLAATGKINIQKSQQGGGSPIIRGFEANKILLVIDGVRMNNLIYRGGHLQNVLSIDQNILEKVEVLMGSSSTIYGSDALGGVLHFQTRNINFDSTNKHSFTGFARYSSSNNENSLHLDYSFAHKRFTNFVGFNLSKFGDLKMGNQIQALDSLWGLRNYTSEWINNKDSVLKNTEPLIQKKSGYKQIDFINKIAYKINPHLTISTNNQFSTTGNVPRFDRLTDTQNNQLINAEWYYGPQLRFLSILNLTNHKNSSIFKNWTINLSYQHIEESRHSRKFGNDTKKNNLEKVTIWALNTYTQHETTTQKLNLGLDFQTENLESTAFTNNVKTNQIIKNGTETRYPDGDNHMTTLAMYASQSWKINYQWRINDGVRIGLSKLYASFVNQKFFPFPFNEIAQQNFIFSGEAGVVFTPNFYSKTYLNGSSGYRTPNIDDLAKIFDSKKGEVIFPNPDLKPERSFNVELGNNARIFKNTYIETIIYYTLINDAITIDKGIYNNKDSILYNNTLSLVRMPFNKQKANIYGFSFRVESQVFSFLNFSGTINYTKGEIINSLLKKENLDHISPLTARLGLIYKKNKLKIEVNSLINGSKKIKDYRLGTEDNEQYATPMGTPYWAILNLSLQYHLNKNIQFQTGVENIQNIQYRTFASGINAAGRNFWFTTRFEI